MKKLILLGLSVALTACSTPQQQSTVPMDMQAVQDYHQRVINKQTVDKNTKQHDEPLNQSDKRSESINLPIHPIIYPSIGVGYHYGWKRYRY
ncbi:TPA: hypothetical protein PXF07_000991 [Mannheimia haemolytica]|uniref:Lipoprotein n=1 Tax=Mannheimia haemolytica TaxID=75985 RepID=A0A249A2P4_MANHA|nr:hypothetical protein [Mannheimia haemolytica]AWW71997.1 hypothetical protein C4O86_09525 [Pasteurellaceae bacterium 12565]AGI33274.1 hypothetical protein D650_20050 [Mannheimia haemolytica USDA-ARS-USMARC-183]AGI34761.1 hypothetical protein D648_7570 [Mannheimia haemolytica USDA-ARS-USMARC-185]AGK01809.1 putative lipoprotein [Mannheimia haemolytica M42548]AGQ26606.1 hypothetical protein F382_11885 [Mannheimia haemolytica D153]